MLIALLSVYLGFMAFAGPAGVQFGELASTYFKDQIKITIPDKERRDDALQALSSVVYDLKDFNQQTSKDLKALEKLIRNYDSKPEDFDRLFASALATREQQMDKLWDDRRAVLIHIQPDEWRKIVSNARAEAEKKAEKKTRG